jgi:hypothetical protein
MMFPPTSITLEMRSGALLLAMMNPFIFGKSGESSPRFLYPLARFFADKFLNRSRHLRHTRGETVRSWLVLNLTSLYEPWIPACKMTSYPLTVL